MAGTDVVQLLDTPVYFELVGLPYPAERRGVLERFVKEKLLLDKGNQYAITNLGALLFAKNLEQFDLLHRKAPRVERVQSERGPS